VGSALVFWAYRRPEALVPAARVGIVVGRKSGGAAERNLFKRRVREVFRKNKHRLGRGWDVVAAPKFPGKTPSRFPPPYEAVEKDFLGLAEFLARHGDER